MLNDKNKMFKRKINLYCSAVLFFIIMTHIFASLESQIESKRFYSDEDIFYANFYGMISVISCLLSSLFLLKLYNLGVEMNEEKDSVSDSNNNDDT